MRTAVTVLCIAMLASPASAYAECKCIFKGGEVKEGQTACIMTPNGPVIARCSKQQNVSSWEILKQACPFNDAEIPKQSKLKLAQR